MDNTEKITEEKIFEAAAEVFEEKGLAGSRMQEIADRAGINKALLHYYFRTKEKLFDAVFSHLAGFMFQKLFACIDNDLPLDEKLQMFYQEHISFLQKHPRLPAFIFNEINQHPERLLQVFGNDRIISMRQKLFDQLDEEMKAGRIRQIDKVQLLINIVALSVFPFAAQGIVRIIMKEEQIQFDDFVEQRKTELPVFIINAMKVQ